MARLLLRAESVASSRIEGLEVGARRLLRAEAAKFCNDESLPAVAQAAMAHARFETIHPFSRWQRQDWPGVDPARLAAARSCPACAPAGACTRAVSDAASFELRVEPIERERRALLGRIRSDCATDLLLKSLAGAPVLTWAAPPGRRYPHFQTRQARAPSKTDTLIQPGSINLFRILQDKLRQAWSDQLAAGVIAICPLVELEFLHSARSLTDRLGKRRLLRELFGWVTIVTSRSWPRSLVSRSSGSPTSEEVLFRCH